MLATLLWESWFTGHKNSIVHALIATISVKLFFLFSPLKFIFSNHGKTQLVDSGGYVYYKSNQYNGKTSWKCTSCYKMKCKARFTTDDVSLHVLKSNKEHNH